jgi:hypothetical protein
MRELEWEYDENTMLIGSVDQDGGVDLSVVIWIKNINYDLTKGFTERQLNGFKEEFREWWERQRAVPDEEDQWREKD